MVVHIHHSKLLPDMTKEILNNKSPNLSSLLVVVQLGTLAVDSEALADPVLPTTILSASAPSSQPALSLAAYHTSDEACSWSAASH